MNTVLVVDDDGTNRTLASRLLSKLGWNVAMVEDGGQALAWLAANQADLVLLDISMPNMSGEDVCRRIRAETLGGTGLKVTAYTAHAMPEDQQRFLANGFDAVLVKPVSRGRMAEMLAALGFPAE